MYARPLVQFNKDESLVLPGGNFVVEIQLQHSWRKENITSKWGRLAYLYLLLNSEGEEAKEQYDI